MSLFLKGLLLGASLIIAIGAQNAYVLKQGLLKRHVFLVCLKAMILTSAKHFSFLAVLR